MARKKATSNLPGELNENWGSNYMMDGFWHDMEYGHGVQEGIGSQPVPQPAMGGMSHLPGGVIVSEADPQGQIACPDSVELEGGLDLGELAIVASSMDRSNTGIVDLRWLSDATQDPARLPENNTGDVIPELQEAWGNRTDGIQRIDMTERGDLYDTSQGPVDDDIHNMDKLAALVQAAMRHSADGDLSLARKCKAFPKLARAITAIESEHGLVGNVYVRAAAYPRLQRGPWAKPLRKAARGCQYLIAEDTEFNRAAADALQLQMVDHPKSIDWDAVYTKYAPRLAATGRLDRLATVADKRETLRQAFLMRESSPQLETPKRVDVVPVMPVDRVSAEQAQKALLSFKPSQREVLSQVERERQIQMGRVQQKLGAWVQARLLTQEDVDRLMQSQATPLEILRTASRLVTITKTGQYSGHARHKESAVPAVDATSAQVQRHTKQAQQEQLEQDARVDQLRKSARTKRAYLEKLWEKVGRIEQMVGNKASKEQLKKALKASFTLDDFKRAQERLVPILMRGGFYEKEASSNYQGVVQTQVYSTPPDFQVSPQEVKKVARWLRQSLNEGVAGEQLDQLIRIRLTPKVVQASAKKISAIRRVHEGLAGHLYVDAKAYQSKVGTKGCDEGALRHRTNPIKFLLAMDRCEGCVNKNADGVCQKYNKTVVDQLPEDVESYRQQTLASHRMTDQEMTADLFSVASLAPALGRPGGDFELHNAQLDQVETEESPTPSDLEGIFFGGFNL